MARMRRAAVDRFEALRGFDPHHAPDWRWRAAEGLARDGRAPTPDPRPPAVAEAAAYLRARGRSQDDHDRKAVLVRWPDLAAAHRLAREGGPPLWEVQARILARQADAEVAARCGLTLGTVRRYESLFFAVRDRLAAGDWVHVNAIRLGPGPWRTCHDLGQVWRTLGYHAGPWVLELVLAATTGRPLPAWARDAPGAGPAGRGERLRLRCGLLVDALLLPADADPFALFRLNLEALRARAARRPGPVAPSLARRAAEVLASSEIRRPRRRPTGPRRSGPERPGAEPLRQTRGAAT
jgi:hypothetical protein